MLMLIVVPGVACGGGSGGMTTNGLQASFTGSGTPASPDQVRLTGSASGDRVLLEVAVAGPTTSDDLYAFAFDVVLGNPAVLGFVAGSAVLGQALSTEGCLGETVLAQQSDDRIVVGISKLGSCPGNGVPAGERTLVRLTLRALDAGSCTVSIAGAPTGTRRVAGEPTAYDSSLSPVDTIRFDEAAATITTR